MIITKLTLLRFPAAVALSVLMCACKNEANSLDFVQDKPEPAAKTEAAPLPDGDHLNRMAKQSRKSNSLPEAPAAEPDGGFIQVKLVKKGPAIKAEPPLAPLKHTKSKLAEFQNAPFPYRGTVPSTGRAFLDVNEDGRRGHRTSSGAVYWEDQTYKDSRTLLHIPRGFDLRRPALMVVFLHGHGATLQRDVIERQRVPEQVSEAGINAVLVAPQLASDAADSSAGKLWEPGGFERFLEEASAELTRLHGDSRAKPVFDKMPVVIVAYSGGYMTAASCIRHGGAGERVRGVVLLDALYGDIDTFAGWISTRQKAFFLSAYANSTRAHNTELAEILKGRDVAVKTKLQGPLRGGSVTFISTDPETEHRDFVTKAWTNHPVKDLLQRLRVEAR
jgi:pimeloyl-ACP methyl ester carboxylesterase